MALFWLLGHIPRAIVRHLLVWLVDLKRGKLRCCRSRLKMIILLLSGWNKDDVHFRFSDEKIQRDSKYYIYMIWIYGDVRGGLNSKEFTDFAFKESSEFHNTLSKSYESEITLKSTCIYKSSSLQYFTETADMMTWLGESSEGYFELNKYWHARTLSTKCSFDHQLPFL